MPVAEVAYGICLANRHRNYPADMPVLMHAWWHQCYPIELRWSPEELQVPTEAYLSYLATPDDYKK